MKNNAPIDFSFSALVKNIFRYREGITQIILLHIIWSLTELIFPFLTILLIDQGIGFSDLNFILLLLLARLALFIGTISSDFLKVWILRHIGIRMNIQIIRLYMHKILHKEVLFFNTNNEGVLIQHANDNMRIERFLTDSLQSLLNASFKILLLSIVLLFLHTLIAICFIAFIVVLIIWDMVYLKGRAKIDAMQFKVMSENRKELLEATQGIYDIKVNNLQQERGLRWHDQQNKVADLRFKILSSAHNYYGINQSINQIMYAVITFLACYAVLQGDLTLGAFLAIQYILGQAVKPTNDFTTFIQEYQDAKLSLERMRDIFDNKLDFSILNEDNAIPKTSGTNINQSIQQDITFHQIAFSYSKSFALLENINLNFPFGSKIAIVGKSGSGKSTLLKLILKLIKPTHGNIQVGHQDLKNIPDEVWMQQFGVLLQESIAFNGSIEYNITFQSSQEVDYDSLSKALEWSQFAQVLEGLPEGIHTLLGKNGQNLSKGQVQRLLIARVLYKNANYFVLDEPTSALDNETSAAVMRNLMLAAKNKMLIITTHNLNLTKDFDWVIFVDKGEIIEQGKPAELLKNKSNYFELLFSN